MHHQRDMAVYPEIYRQHLIAKIVTYFYKQQLTYNVGYAKI